LIRRYTEIPMPQVIVAMTGGCLTEAPRDGEGEEQK
jgi:hypothetical protein